MKTVLIFLLMSFAVFSQQQLIAKDSNGLVIEVKEKYGSYFIDTCTVVMNYNDQFVIVHRDGTSSWFPASFHSVKIVKKIIPDKRLVGIQLENNNTNYLQ